MNRIFIIGISGFLGSNISRHLINANSDIESRGLSRQPSQITNAPKIIECVQGDIKNPDSLAGLFKGIHTVIHVASKVRASDSGDYYQTNVVGTKNIIELCLREGVERIIFISNAAVYGMELANGVVEHNPIELPKTPISLSRYKAEELLLSYHKKKLIEVLILRPMFVYGRGDEFFIPPIVRTLNRIPFIINEGKAKLSVISVDDLAEAILALSQKPWPETEFPVYHLNDGFPITFKEIVMTLHKELGVRYPRISLPYSFAVLSLALGGLKNKIFIRKSLMGEGRSISQKEFMHRIHLVSFNHYFSNARLVSLLPEMKFKNFVKKFQDYLNYYETILLKK